MDEKKINRYLELVDRRLFILIHSGSSWQPEYEAELEAIDRELGELRKLVDEEHEKRDRKEMEEMPVPKDTTMLKPDSRKFLVAMAEKEMEPAELAQAAGISKNIVYTMRRGFYTKPKYLGAVARVLEVKVSDLIEDEGVKVKTCEE